MTISHVKQSPFLGYAGFGGGAGGILIRLIQEAGGYKIKNSLRFDSGKSSFLSRTPIAKGNGQTWTWSGWIKRTQMGLGCNIFGANSAASDTGYLSIHFGSDDTITSSGNNTIWRITTQRFRDPSAWYHLVFVADTTNAVADDRFRWYCNGKRITSFSTNNAIPQNTTIGVNTKGIHTMSRYPTSGGHGGYMSSEVYFIDGLALSPAAFGAFDSNTGVWNPSSFSLPAPNEGSTLSSGWSGTFTSGLEATKSFDGDLTTGSKPSNNYSITWTGDIEVKQGVRIYFECDDHSSAKYADIFVNGIPITPTAYNSHWDSADVVNWGVNNLTEIKTTQASNRATLIKAIEVDGVILVDGQTDPTDRNNLNDGTTWSDQIAITGSWDGSHTNVKMFDGSAATRAEPADGALVTWTPASAITGRLRMLMAAGNYSGGATGNFDIKINDTSVFSASPPPVNKTDWVDFGTVTNMTTFKFGRDASGGSNGKFIQAKLVEVDGHVLIDSSVDNSFHLKFNETANEGQLGHDAFVDSAVDTNPVYSACTDGAQANYPASYGFNGSLLSFGTNGPNGGGIYKFDFTKIGGVAYTNGVQCYLDNTTNGQFDRTRVNGGSWTTHNTGGNGDRWEWVSVAAGSGTMNTFEIEDDPTNGVSGAAEGSFRALRINGDTVLTDRAGNNFTVTNLAAAATGSRYTSGTDWNSKIWDGSLTSQGGVTAGSYEVLTDQSITVNTSFEIYTNDENGQVNTIKDGDGNEYQCDSDAGTGSYWRPLYNANSQSGTNYTGTLTGPIQIKVSYGGSHIYAVKVDGVILTETKAVDVSVDTPTDYKDSGGVVHGNYCTLNPLDQLNSTVSNGNLTLTQASDPCRIRGTMSMRPNTGKWYYEMTVMSGSSYDFGMKSISSKVNDNTENVGYYGHNGNKNVNNSSSSYGATYGAGDTVAILYDSDNGTVNFYKNNADQGQAASSLTDEYLPWIYLDNYGTTPVVDFNFGQRSWKYTPPTGAQALCTLNLPDTFGDNDDTNNPSKYFDILTYTGNEGTQSIKGLGFQSDLMWLKNRDSATDHQIYDAVRSTGTSGLKRLRTNLTNAEAEGDGSNTVNFLSDGFSLSGGGGDTNDDGKKYVSWNWDAGTAANGSTNTDGDNITVAVGNQWVNATAGFSITKYAGDGSGSANSDSGDAVGHGLSTAPDFIVTKKIDGTNGWPVYHSALANSTDHLNLQTSGAIDPGNYCYPTAPTATKVDIGNNPEINNTGSNYIMYSWTSIPGYSAFGKYFGNGSNSGTMVVTGFKVKFIIIKRSDSTGNWGMNDVARDFNGEWGNDASFYANTAAAESTSSSLNIDLLSNGFKLRSNNSSYNLGTGTYIYCAFAEHPFKVSRAV